MTEVNGVGRRRTQLLMIWESEEDIGRKLKIEKGGNDSLSVEHKEDIKYIFYKSKDLLRSSVLNYINNIKSYLGYFKKSKRYPVIDKK